MTERDLTDDEIDAILWRVRKPAIAMVRVENQSDPGTPGCWLGGKPTLPPEIEWPIYHHQHPKISVPMHFLVQINLAYMPRVLELPKLPETGTLFVFIDTILAPMAEDSLRPPPLSSGLAARVIYVPEDVAGHEAREAPPLPDYDDVLAPLADHQINGFYPYVRESGVTTASGLHRWAFDPVVIETIPQEHQSFNHSSSFLNRRIDFREKQIAAISAYRNKEAHAGPEDMWMFGADQLVDFPSEEYLSQFSDWQQYRPALTEDHIQLFRFESSEAIGFQNTGQQPLSFWITLSDLENRNFNNVVVWESE